MAAQQPPALAVAANGTVWLGISRNLVMLDPVSGRVESWAIPTPRDNPADEHFRPAREPASHAATAIAVSSGGTVAIAMSYASSVELFDPTRHRFESVNLPTRSDLPLMVAFGDSGTLAVGMADIATGGYGNEVLLIRGSARHVVSIPEAGAAGAITAYAGRGFIVGAVRPYLVSAAGKAVAISAPANLIGGSQTPMATLVLPHGLFAGVTSNGLETFPARSASRAAAAAHSQTLALGKVSCTRFSSRAPSKGHHATYCGRPGFEVLATDADGDVWAVPLTDDATEVLLLSSTL